MSNINFFPVKVKKNIANQKTCGECTKCCEGYLTCNVLGQQLGNGVGCNLVSKTGCSIYESRPTEPCKSYSCYWLQHENLPDYMRPDKSNVILTERKIEDQPYLQALEAGKKIDSTILAELINYSFRNGFNLEYQVNSKLFYLGNAKFIAIVEKNKPN